MFPSFLSLVLDSINPPVTGHRLADITRYLRTARCRSNLLIARFFTTKPGFRIFALFSRFGDSEEVERDIQLEAKMIDKEKKILYVLDICKTVAGHGRVY